jgi:formamidopyrimidine-DNA glycosylase
MPELPEVETVRRGLAERALGRRMTEVEIANPSVIAGAPETFVAGIRGSVLSALERKGKALALTLERENGAGPRFLLVRLGMTGQLTIEERDAPLRDHTHVRVALGDGAFELRYRDVRRFGRLRLCSRKELEGIFGRLGPDARLIREDEFLAALCGRRGAIKSWLMNQQFLSGLGNIYADEALFAARLHPLTPAGRVTPQAARALYRAVRKVLDRALAMRGTTFRDYIGADGEPGEFLSNLRVYQRAGEPCRRCRAPIRRLIIAGRSSHFCPRCQPRPRRPAKMRGPRRGLSSPDQSRASRSHARLSCR